MNKIILIFILLLIGFGIYVFIELKVKKWKCTEGRCEKIIGGDFTSLEKCREMCKITPVKKVEHKRVRWNSNLVEYEP